MTHAQLVDTGAAWLKRAWRCPVVITELHTSAGEVPDVIGWDRMGRTIVVEAKCSKSDFASDRKKSFRRYPESGMGDFRFFITAPGLLRDATLPVGWGLVEAGAPLTVVARSHGADCFCHERERPYSHCAPAFEKKAARKESLVLLSLIRRIAGPCGMRGQAKLIVDAYKLDEKGQPIGGG